MPAINLPAINIDKEDFKSKETMENILDTLIKYRKELNYLLMNLDVDNMPLVGGLIGEIEGNYSLLTQTVDGIYMQVGNIEGDMADFRVEADNISAMVTNQSGDIASLTIQADNISTIVGNHSGDIAALVVRATSVETTVASHTGQISSVVQTASSLTSTVAALDTEVGGFYSQVNQLSNEISSVVSFTDVTGQQIASKINQSASSVKIEAKNIDLTGITTIYSPLASNYYAQFSAMADFSLYSAGNNVFTIRNGGDYSSFISFSKEYLKFSSTGSKAVLYNTWDFSSATVTGLTLKWQ